MTRTRAELQLLVEAAQVAALAAYLVDLGLPWWTETDPIAPVGTVTGWAGLGGGFVGPASGAWLTAISMVAVALALPPRRRWLSLVAGAAGLLTAGVLAVSIARDQGMRFGYAHAGLWVGCLLPALSGLLGLVGAALIAARAREGGGPP